MKEQVPAQALRRKKHSRSRRHAQEASTDSGNCIARCQHEHVTSTLSDDLVLAASARSGVVRARAQSSQSIMIARESDTAVYPAVIPDASGVPWLRAHWRSFAGYARRWHLQPFPGVATLYLFIPDEAEEMFLSGEVLGLGHVPRARREQVLARRRGPIFPAVVAEKEGIARRIEHTPLWFSWWHFLGKDGVALRVPDTEIEVYHPWGDAWERRLGNKARKLKRQRGRRRRSAPEPSAPLTEKKSEQ